MRKSNRVVLVFGALITASIAAVHCGGDDTSGGGTAGTPSAGGSAGSGGGAAGSLAGVGGGGSSVAAGGMGGAVGGAGGAAGMAGKAGGAGAPVGDSGPSDAPLVGDAGACPAAQPAEDSACTKQQACNYAMGTTCHCAKFKGADASRAWTCLSNDAGPAAADAEACPATVNDGDACTTKGQRCPSADAGATCVCSRDVWNCP